MPDRDARTDEQLRILIQQLARRIRNNRAGDDLGFTQLGVLFHLEAGESSPGELAARESVTPPSMNRTLNGLERAGLVTRRPDEADARRIRVAITPAGRTRAAQTRAARTAWFAQRLDELSAAERRMLEAAVPVLRKLVAS
jgi:DNA-binding MarR family transcriptional regulator